ncbi:hypothetical protein ACFWHQ_41090 [Streptomyces sp. NPDC060334]|uniref:hypothetical protein n=1 Tax=Streptomyces sp. NPDC060334 TaxID=3347099 RepID=UPI00364D8CDE
MANSVFQTQDALGKVTTAVFSEQAPAPSAHFFELAAAVPNDFVVIGGGAVGTDDPGALLTASFPSGDRQKWLASSKDHGVSSPHRLQTFAIGLKIAGLTPDQLKTHLKYVSADSGSTAHPTKAVATPPPNPPDSADFIMISGGFRVNWPPGDGNLATASFPEIGGTWRASSKDHQFSNPCTITCFGVALRSDLPGIGRVVRGEASTLSNQAAHPSVDTQLPAGFALTGIGAEANSTGAGQLLWQLAPIAPRGARASSKDHQISSPGKVKAFALGIKII